MRNQNSIDELQTRIKSEIVIIKKLLELAGNKKNLIIKNNIDEIDRINQEENETLLQLEELGFERQSHVLDICKEYQLKVTEKLGDLIPQLSNQTSRQVLTALRSELLSLYHRLSQYSSLNGKLLAQSAEIGLKLFKRLSHADQQMKNSNYSRFSKNTLPTSGSSSSFRHQG